MTTILLARHGETDWNRERRYQGHLDPPLNELGRRQAYELADALAGERFDAIYSSDLGRAHETAEIVGARLGLPVTSDPGLREIHLGSWAGLTRDEVAERFPGAEGHGGETDHEFEARVVGAVQRIVELHPRERVLIVSHGGSLRMLERHATGGSPRVLGNCEVYRLAFEDGAFRAVD